MRKIGRLEFYLTFGILLDIAGMIYATGLLKNIYASIFIVVFGTQLILNTILWAYFKESIKRQVNKELFGIAG